MTHIVCFLVVVFGVCSNAAMLRSSSQNATVAMRDLVDVSRQLAGTLTRKGNDGDPRSAFPLDECEGDCDNDRDCKSGLKCFKRDDTRPVPGCSGTGKRGMDYCYDPSGGGGGGGGGPSGGGGGGGTRLVTVGNNGNPRNAFPLGRCEADCDKDDDCQGTMVCYKRDNGDPGPPGCTGTPRRGDDYCIRRSDLGGGGRPTPSPTHPPGPPTGPPPGNGFRLKMYWEDGYFWQESRRERFWCWQCEGSNCGNGDKVKIRRCGGSNDKFEFINRGNGEIQIRSNNVCLALEGARRLRMRNCNSNDRKQRWNNGGRGSFNGGGRFEIHPVSKNGCVTQHHHPKDGEELQIDNGCSKARFWDTSYFVKY